MADAHVVSDDTAIAERCLAAWNQTDPDARRRAVEEAFAPEARYVDPLTVADGIDAIVTTIAAAQAQFPSMTFQLQGRSKATTSSCASVGSLGCPTSQRPPLVPTSRSSTRTAG